MVDSSDPKIQLKLVKKLTPIVDYVLKHLSYSSFCADLRTSLHQTKTELTSSYRKLHSHIEKEKKKRTRKTSSIAR